MKASAMNFLVFLVLVYSAMVDCFPDSKVPRMIGGEYATKNQFPYQVGVTVEIDEGYFMCGGSIIGKQHILSAAHCFKTTDPSKTTIYKGSIEWLGGQEFGVQEITIHPNWSRKTDDHDVAVVKLIREIILDETAQAIALPESDIADKYVNAVTTGWGETSRGGDSSILLKYLNVKAYSTSQCNILLEDDLKSNRVDDNMICSWPSSTCLGDSGGPLVANNIQIGITSFGWGKCADKTPDVYTKVFAQMDFINNCLKE